MPALDFVGLGGFWVIFMNCSSGRPGGGRRSPAKSVLTSKLSRNATKTCNSDRDNDHCEYNGVVRSMSLPRRK